MISNSILIPVHQPSRCKNLEQTNEKLPDDNTLSYYLPEDNTLSYYLPKDNKVSYYLPKDNTL